jgi:hypothetical protein
MEKLISDCHEIEMQSKVTLYDIDDKTLHSGLHTQCP